MLKIVRGVGGGGGGGRGGGRGGEGGGGGGGRGGGEGGRWSSDPKDLPLISLKTPLSEILDPAL